METKPLAATAMQVPELGLGTCNYDAGPEVLRRGLDAGALFIDTAESYGSEPVVAEAIAGRRESVFVATKVSAANFRRESLLRAADGSLLRLRTGYIDLYQLHEPNEAIPLEETLGAMEELVEAGKVRFIGVSNFSLAQLERARAAMSRHPIVSNQVRYNLADRTIEAGLLSYCQRQRITVIAYSPLAREFQRILDCDPQGVLDQIARECGRTRVQVALNWCLCHEGVLAIPKASTEAHVVENCGASGWRLSREQLSRLDESILFRRRAAWDRFLRRLVPRRLRGALLGLVRLSPRALRRRIT